MGTEVYQTVREKDGIISAYIRFTDDSGKVIKQVCVQGKTQDDFEKKITRYNVDIDTEKAEKITDTEIVLAAINNLKLGRGE